MLQDKTLWEDLCKLEGSLGMRYLTHESEDNFWTSHGAKPHPLAQAKSPSMEEVAVGQSARSVKFSQDEEVVPHSSPVSSLGKTGSSDRGSRGSLDKPDDQDGRSSTSSSGSKKDYVHMTDDEIVKAQAHAKRVGYKISTL